MTNFNHHKHLYARSKSSNRGVRGFHREQGYFGAVRKGFHPVNKRRPIVSVPKLAKSNGSDLPSTPSNAVSVASTSSAIASNISTVQNQSEIQVSSVEGASDGSETQNVLSITADVKSSSTDRVDCVDVLEAASTSNEMDNDNSDMVPESLTSDVIDAQKIRSDIDPTTTFGLTVDDRYKIRHFSMRGNESSHTLNEDAVRIGKRQDDKNFGIVCDGISTPFGSHSFVNAFINFNVFAKRL